MQFKVDNKQKIKYLRNYITQLKASPEAQKFINILPLECGFYDYEYITRRRMTILDVQKNLKDNKYQHIKEVCEDLKNLFLNVSDYLLLNDPLQQEIVRMIKVTMQLQSKFGDFFRENRVVKVEAKPERKDIVKGKQKDDGKDNKQNANAKQKQKQKVGDLIVEYNRKSTFAERLQMFFYLKSHEDNMQYVKSIGDGYGIGCEDTVTGDYMVKLQVNASTCPWLQLLQKKDE